MRYCVNAALTVDAWAYIEASDKADALEKARALSAGDFEQGDPFHVQIDGVEEDE